MKPPTAEQIREARRQAEIRAFKRFGEEMQAKQLPKWIDVVSRVKR